MLSKIPLVLTLIALSADPTSTALVMPLADISSQDVMRQYLAPMTPYSSGHRGIDLPGAIGTEILSPATGTISFVGVVGYRSVISVQFGSSFTASLEPACSDLVEGTSVSVGEPIGLLCEPAAEYEWHCPESCLHFGTRNDQGYFSPLAIIGGLPPSRLVPYALG